MENVHINITATPNLFKLEWHLHFFLFHLIVIYLEIYFYGLINYFTFTFLLNFERDTLN